MVLRHRDRNVVLDIKKNAPTMFLLVSMNRLISWNYYFCISNILAMTSVRAITAGESVATVAHRESSLGKRLPQLV